MNETETVNVLHHMEDLRKAWKAQDFRFTKEQKEQYDLLLAARRDRVNFFHKNNMVFKGPKICKQKEETVEE